MYEKGVIRCEKCKQPVLEGIAVSYPHGEDDIYEDVLGGRYYEGAGECELCGRELCADCGDFEDGVCRECREEGE